VRRIGGANIANEISHEPSSPLFADIRYTIEKEKACLMNESDLIRNLSHHWSKGEETPRYKEIILDEIQAFDPIELDLVGSLLLGPTQGRAPHLTATLNPLDQAPLTHLSSSPLHSILMKLRESGSEIVLRSHFRTPDVFLKGIKIIDGMRQGMLSAAGLPGCGSSTSSSTDEDLEKGTFLRDGRFIIQGYESPSDEAVGVLSVLRDLSEKHEIRVSEGSLFKAAIVSRRYASLNPILKTLEDEGIPYDTSVPYDLFNDKEVTVIRKAHIQHSPCPRKALIQHSPCHLKLTFNTLHVLEPEHSVDTSLTAEGEASLGLFKTTGAPLRLRLTISVHHHGC